MIELIPFEEYGSVAEVADVMNGIVHDGQQRLELRGYYRDIRRYGKTAIASVEEDFRNDDEGSTSNFVVVRTDVRNNETTSRPVGKATAEYMAELHLLKKFLPPITAQYFLEREPVLKPLLTHHVDVFTVENNAINAVPEAKTIGKHMGTEPTSIQLPIERLAYEQLVATLIDSKHPRRLWTVLPDVPQNLVTRTNLEACGFTRIASGRFDTLQSEWRVPPKSGLYAVASPGIYGGRQ